MLRDKRIENEVRLALECDSRIKHPELIAVAADPIGAVFLRGAVEDPVQHHAATQDAHQIEGVLSVIADDLRVHPHAGHHGSDDHICAAAVRRLTDDPRIRSTHIHVKVLHGRVTLKGHVSDDKERAAATKDVEELAGVVEVINRIDVR